MAVRRGVLAQKQLTGASLDDIYSVPTGKQTVISTITVCNTNAVSDDAFRMSIGVGGAADSPQQYFYWDMPLPALQTFAITFGITMEADDALRAQSVGGDVIVCVFGEEDDV